MVKLGRESKECRHCGKKIIRLSGVWFHERTRIRMCKSTGKEYAEPK